MTIFEAVKTRVTPRMAAEYFGLRVSPNGVACCPFHEDRHPSMKLNEDTFYCFSCGAQRDVIAFASRLFAVTQSEAAENLTGVFGIRRTHPAVLAKIREYQTQSDNEKLYLRVLREYLRILQGWKQKYSPQAPEDDPDSRFVGACHMLLLTSSPQAERTELVKA